MYIIILDVARIIKAKISLVRFCGSPVISHIAPWKLKLNT
jgi:hypothetical protein